MTAIILNIAYFITLLAAAPWLAYQSVFRGKYRAGFAAKFWGVVPQRNSTRPCIWLHAVSVGEVNLLAVLLKEIAQHRPDVECVISTTTKTGYDLATNKYSQHTVFYCPLDFSWAVRRAKTDSTQCPAVGGTRTVAKLNTSSSRELCARGDC